MATLTPTVHERLARCGTQVFLDGLSTGADVEIDISGSIIDFVATGSSRTQTVPSLNGDDEVRARQNDGSGWTPWSPALTVEDANVPPTSAPLLPAQVGSCSQCVLVRGLVPGCEVELIQGGMVVGNGRADRHGNKCLSLKLSQDEVLRARMIVCGAMGPESQTPVVPGTALPKPVVGSPLYGCQRIVPLSNLHLGSLVRIESSVSGSLGSICSCWNAVNVRVGAELVVGHQIRGQAYWDSEERCKQESAWSEWEDVVAPDEGITPELLPALIHNDQIIRVANQIIGAELNIYIADSEDPADLASPQVFGPRPASDEPEIMLNAPLVEGQVVWVDQTLCGVTYVSEQILVLGLPDVILPPFVLEPLYGCAARVTVTGLYAGATVRVYQDGFPIAWAWAGEAATLAIDVAPTLVAGGTINAKQWVGGVESGLSNDVIVQNATSNHQPRILQPVTLGDHWVWVSGVTPGAKVSIYVGGVFIGEAEAAESIVKVSTTEITGPVTAKVTICGGLELNSEPTNPIKSPCEAGDLATGSRFEDFGSFTSDVYPDGGGYEVPIRGTLYYPTLLGGCLTSGDSSEINPDVRNLPLVVVAHGYWTEPVANPSYTGYRYLAHHLASWGMIVYSIDLDIINDNTSETEPQASTRGQLILKAIESILADSEIARHINQENIGLIGHSMGGEAVVVAQHLNLASGSPYSIKGVVSIAPTQYREDVSLKEAEYLQLLGSEDYLLDSDVLMSDADARFNGFRIYDRADRNKSHAWIQGGTHRPFNIEWTKPVDDDYPVTVGGHRTIAKCLINAFFQTNLKGQPLYEGYLEGLIFPPSIRPWDIYLQHLKTDREVLDNFGDADAQAGLGAQALNKLLNRVPDDNNANGPGITIWEDVESVGAGTCVHNTKCVELAWNAPTGWYQQKGVLNISNPVKCLSFRIAQYFEDAALNEHDREIDLLVEASDGAQTATVRMGLIGTSPYPDDSRQTYSVFRSIRIPADAFDAVNPTINMGSINSVTLKLTGRATGHILVDDLEFDG